MASGLIQAILNLATSTLLGSPFTPTLIQSGWTRSPAAELLKLRLRLGVQWLSLSLSSSSLLGTEEVCWTVTSSPAISYQLTCWDKLQYSCTLCSRPFRCRISQSPSGQWLAGVITSGKWCARVSQYASVCARALISVLCISSRESVEQREWSKREKKAGWQDWDNEIHCLLFSPLTNNQTQQFALYCCFCFSEAVEMWRHVCCFSLKIEISIARKPFIHFIWALSNLFWWTKCFIQMKAT